MSIIRRRHNSGFKAMPNALFEDERISFDARGMIGYLLVKPDHWSVNVKDLCRAGSIGRDKVYKLLAELVDAGYIIRRQPRDKDGRVGAIEYIVMDEPMADDGDEAWQELAPESPLPEIPDTAFPDTDSPDTVNPHHSKESVCSKESTAEDCAAPAARRRPPKRKVSPTKPDDPVQPHIALVDAMAEELGHETVDYPRHVRAARKMVVELGATPDDIRRVIRWVMADKRNREFYATQPFSMETARKYYEAAMNAAESSAGDAVMSF